MLAGQTASYNGYQYCLFPLDTLNCTQTSSPSSYSHCCGHPCDWIGQTAQYPYYAPCDCTRIWTYPSDGESIYTSDNPVWTPSGLKYVSFLFAHDNNIPAQTHFNQGELIGHTGTAGFVTGDHVHLDQSLIHNDVITNYGITCSGGNVCWALGSSTYPDLVFYLTGDEIIVDTKGMEFDTVPEPPAPTASALLLMMLYKKKKGDKAYGRIQRHTGTV